MKTKICTDIEQSKKLIELGIDPNTSDMYYQYVLPKSDKIKHNPEVGNPVESLKWYNSGYTFSGKKDPITLEEYCIPAWSLSALLELMSYCRIETYAGGFFSTYYRSHGAMNEVNHFEDGKTPVDAAFEMVCWLKENEKI